MTETSLADDLPGLIVQHAELIFPQSFWSDVGSNIQPAGERGFDVVLRALHADAPTADFLLAGTGEFLEPSQIFIVEELIARFAGIRITSVHEHYCVPATRYHQSRIVRGMPKLPVNGNRLAILEGR